MVKQSDRLYLREKKNLRFCSNIAANYLKIDYKEYENILGSISVTNKMNQFKYLFELGLKCKQKRRFFVFL